MSIKNPLMTEQFFNSFFPPHVLTFVSDRRYDFALDPDKGLNDQQIAALRDEFGYSLPPIYNIRQVHGDHIVYAASDDTATIVEADGVITDQYDLPIAVRTADCLSVFLYDKTKEVLGLVHAGWRSTQKKIVAKTVELMHDRFGSKYEQIYVGFGPCIRKDHYEVSAEFQDYFPDEVEERDGRFFFDLAVANKNQLLKKGVKEDHIIDSNICTYEDKICYSYRREGEQAGRMLSLMMLKKEC